MSTPLSCAALPGVTIHNTTAQTAWRAFQPEASGAIRAVRIDRRHHNAVMPCDLPGALQGKFLIAPADTVGLFHRDQHFAGGKEHHGRLEGHIKRFDVLGDGRIDTGALAGFRLQKLCKDMAGKASLCRAAQLSAGNALHQA